VIAGVIELHSNPEEELWDRSEDILEGTVTPGPHRMPGIPGGKINATPERQSRIWSTGGGSESRMHNG
jgi:hypothetical protein